MGCERRAVPAQGCIIHQNAFELASWYSVVPLLVLRCWAAQGLHPAWLLCWQVWGLVSSCGADMFLGAVLPAVTPSHCA